MDLKQKILELFMLDIRYFGKICKDRYLPQTILSKEISEFLKEYPVGGIILFRENIENNEQLRGLVRQLQENVTLQRFIAVDEEGGVVSRLGIESIGNMALGAINDKNATKKTAIFIAEKLASLGINFNFAPVVDISSNPNNHIIGVRSFGSNAGLVTKHAKAFIKGLHKFSIISCIKHFPGHGDTNADTHLGTTNLNKTLDALNSCELIPYKALIQENVVDAIMTAHIVTPALDAHKINNLPTPATLSKEIVTNLLRKKMGFNGVIITDAMDMKAITDNFGQVMATLESLRAGCDIILMPARIWDDGGIQEFKEYFAKVLDACNIDKVLQARINESYKRIVTLKAKFLQAPKPIVNRFPEEVFLTYQNSLAKRSITLYKNEKNHIPFKLADIAKILVIANMKELLETVLIEIADIARQNPSITYVDEIEGACLDYSNLNDKLFKEQLKNISHVIVLTCNLSPQDKDINKLFVVLNQSNCPYVMISCRSPYDINYATKAKTNLLVYGVTGFDQTNYTINKFSLNLKNTLEKLFTANHALQFNHFCPLTDN